jgi:hypothetical protein
VALAHEKLLRLQVPSQFLPNFLGRVLPHHLVDVYELDCSRTGALHMDGLVNLSEGARSQMPDDLVLSNKVFILLAFQVILELSEDLLIFIDFVQKLNYDHLMHYNWYLIAVRKLIIDRIESEYNR